jgi:hypothetical protein
MDALLEKFLDERHQQVMAQFTVVRDELRQTNEKLDIQNGRLRKVETDVAVLKSKDAESRRGVFGKAGAVMGGMLAGLAYWWSSK